MLLLNRLLGGDPDSVLFRKMREKEGLCYDIKSYLYPLSPYLFVQAGIEEKDGRAAGKLVLHCIDEMKEELVSAKRLRQAKAAVQRELEELVDYPWKMTDFFAEQVIQGKPLSTGRWLRLIQRVDGEDIRRAAAHLELKAVYMLSGKEASHGKNH